MSSSGRPRHFRAFALGVVVFGIVAVHIITWHLVWSRKLLPFGAALAALAAVALAHWAFRQRLGRQRRRHGRT